MSKLNRTLIFINLFFLQAYLWRFKIGIYPTNLQEILISLQIIIFATTILKRKKILETLKNLKKYWLIFIFLFLSILPLLFVEIANQLDLYRYLKFLFFAAALIFISLETFKTDSERKNLIKTMGLGTIIFGIFSVLYNLTGYNVAPDYRLLGPLDAAVYLAYYLTPFFIFFTIESIENPGKKSNITYAILIGALLIGTRSMGAIGTSLLIITFYIFKRSNLKVLENKISKIIIILAIILVGSATIYSKILPTLKTTNSSLDERGEIWATAFELLKEPKNLLLGLGPGQFQAHYENNVTKVLDREPLDYYVLQPHNIFLLFIFNYGILGLILLLLIIFQTTKTLFKIKEKPNLQELTALMLSYFLIHGLIDTPIFKNDLFIIFLFLLNLSFSKSFVKSNQR